MNDDKMFVFFSSCEKKIAMKKNIVHHISFDAMHGTTVQTNQ